jgi:hypothetical protein
MSPKEQSDPQNNCRERFAADELLFGRLPTPHHMNTELLRFMALVSCWVASVAFLSARADSRGAMAQVLGTHLEVPTELPVRPSAWHCREKTVWHTLFWDSTGTM